LQLISYFSQHHSFIELIAGPTYQEMLASFSHLCSLSSMASYFIPLNVDNHLFLWQDKRKSFGSGADVEFFLK